MEIATDQDQMHKLLVLLVLIISGTARAQTDGGALVAHYDLHAMASFPEGLAVGGRMRLLPILSIEASAGLLPFVPTLSAGLNMHTAPDIDNDPALSLLGTYFSRSGTKWYVGSLMFGWTSLRKTSLHSTIRLGVSALRAQHSDGSIQYFPAPAIEVGLAWGFQ